MAGLGDTLLGLGQLRQGRATALANLATPLRLTLVAPRGPNPGELRMMTYVPPGLPEGAALVVALHGCTQNAAAYDHGAGWSTLAERHGFALLLPEQTRHNNANLCFNWFQTDDTTRGHGEVESIRAMVEQMVQTDRLDARRVFVTGLSAGGAMTSTLLATLPEVFAGGAIIAGLPYGSATSMQEAFMAMGHPRPRTGPAWGDLVRAASPYGGVRPVVQVWQGDADSTVSPANAEELVRQWTDAMGLGARPDLVETLDGAQHSVWHGADGAPRLERWTVPGLGHGTPIATVGDADQVVGVPSPYMLASSISSTWHLARRWGLLTQPARPAASAPTPAPGRPKAPGGLAGTVVEAALRKAGLLPYTRTR